MKMELIQRFANIWLIKLYIDIQWNTLKLLWIMLQLCLGSYGKISKGKFFSFLKLKTSCIHLCFIYVYTYLCMDIYGYTDIHVYL